MPSGVLDALLILSFLLTLGIVVTIVSHIFIPVPFVPTPKKVLDTLFDFAEVQDGEVLYDLGAGDARVLIAAKRTFPSINAMGIEFVPTIWLLGKLRILFSGQNVTLTLGNALKEDVSNADCIILYLIPSLMEKLEKKFDAQLKPGARVVSYAFTFPNKQPVKEQTVPWITGERKLRMYEW